MHSDQENILRSKPLEKIRTRINRYNGIVDIRRRTSAAVLLIAGGLLITPAYSADKKYPFYTKQATLMCGKAEVKVVSTCRAKAPEEDTPVPSGLCIKQEFTFKYRGKIRKVVNRKRSGDRVTSDPQELWYKAYQWACVPGKKNSNYVFLVYTRATGGNCRECETSSVYDLTGKEIIKKLDPKAIPKGNKLFLPNRKRANFYTIPSAPDEESKRNI